MAQRRTYRAQLHSKREAFWRSTVSSQQKSPHALSITTNNLLGSGRVHLKTPAALMYSTDSSMTR
jgi:hypothetical protein